MTERPGTGMSFNETPLFFGIDADSIFAVLHEPADQSAEAAVVLCHALAEEKHWSHRVYVNFARTMARAGVAVLRPDFRGEGESDLPFEHSGVASRVRDTSAALRWVQGSRPRVRRIILLGHRVGALVAAVAASGMDTPPAGLVLWDPVLDGRAYMMQVLRQHLAAQFTGGAVAPVDREMLLAGLLKGERLYIEGYGFGSPLVQELVESRWVDDARVWRQPTLLLEVSTLSEPVLSPRVAGLTRRGAQLQAAAVRETPFWRETRQFHRHAPGLSAATAKWILRDGP